MRACELVRWWLLVGGVAGARHGIRKRQGQTTATDSCTCPANGLTTTTIVESIFVTSFTTISTDLGTVYSTDPTSTEVTTIISTSTITVTTGTTTIDEPGTTQTSTAVGTVTSTMSVWSSGLEAFTDIMIELSALL